jgi:type I restriction enzyme S subunit
MVVQEGYKQTESGLIPKDWNIRTFKEVSYMKGRIGWQGLNQTEFTMNSNEPFLITGMNFKNGAIRWNEVYHISDERFEIAKDIQLKDDDVLMTKDGTIGKLLYVENIPYPYKASLNSHLLVFRPLKNTYNPKYLYYNLLSPYFFKHIELSKSGTTFFGISQTSVGEYKIILPPITEQTAIATALSDADGLITGLEKLITKKRNIKQGAMHQLLQPKEGWQVKTLGECLLKNPDYGINAAAVEYNDNLPTYLRITDISEKGKYLTSNKASVDHTLSSSYYLEEGDIVFARTGASVGKTYLYNKNDGMLVFAGFLIRVKANPEMLDCNYLFFLTQTNSYWDWVKANSMRSGQPGLNSNEYKSFQIPFPPKEEQTRIATILSDMDAELTALEQKLEKYKKIKLGMMQELLTGKTRLV